MSPEADYVAIRQAVGHYYDGKFAAHGPSARGVDWNSPESQILRFEQLASLFADDRARFSVNDLGCGYGALATFLRERGYAATYAGYDLSPVMVEHARMSFRDDPHVRFREGTGLLPADYSVASGIFNVRLDFGEGEWATYVAETIAQLARASRKGFAFNMLTSHSDEDRKRPDLYYADPCETFEACRARFSRHVALLHDYGLWEFTIRVRLAS